MRIDNDFETLVVLFVLIFLIVSIVHWVVRIFDII